MEKLIRNILVLLLLCSGISAFAQGGYPRPRKEVVIIHKSDAKVLIRKSDANKKLDNVKRQYMAQHLGLSPVQGQKFWPMYDQYQNDLDEVLNLRRANNTAVEPNGTDQFDRELNYQQKITETQKHYYIEFSRIMPPEKAAQVFKIERDFKFELLRRLKEGRNL